jgi:hypothetical protein
MRAWYRWLISVILATWEAELRLSPDPSIARDKRKEREKEKERREGQKNTDNSQI